jgi:hypothetical protein
MRDPDTITSLDDLVLYEDGVLIFDGSDPSTYIVYESAALAAALAAGPDKEDQ